MYLVIMYLHIVNSRSCAASIINARCNLTPTALRHSPSRRRGPSMRVMRPISHSDHDHHKDEHKDKNAGKLNN